MPSTKSPKFTRQQLGTIRIAIARELLRMDKKLKAAQTSNSGTISALCMESADINEVWAIIRDFK